MVPNIASTLKRLQQLAARVAAQGRLLGWLALVWTLAVVMPALLIWPEHGLDRPQLWLLAALSPAGALLGATWGKPWTVLGAGLIGIVPALVACPQLADPEGDRPWSALLLAFAILAACNSALANTTQGQAGLLRFAQAAGAARWRWIAAIGAAWVSLAWWGWPGHVPASDAARATRVTGAAICWSMLASVAVRPAAAAAEVRLQALLGRRMAWLALFGGLLWLWRAKS